MLLVPRSHSFLMLEQQYDTYTRSCSVALRVYALVHLTLYLYSFLPCRPEGIYMPLCTWRFFSSGFIRVPTYVTRMLYRPQGMLLWCCSSRAPMLLGTIISRVETAVWYLCSFLLSRHEGIFSCALDALSILVPVLPPWRHNMLLCTWRSGISLVTL